MKVTYASEAEFIMDAISKFDRNCKLEEKGS